MGKGNTYRRQRASDIKVTLDRHFDRLGILLGGKPLEELKP